MGKLKKHKNVKIANKHLNKLAKRGELRKERKKKRIRLLKLKGEWKPKAKLQESVDKELEAYENIEDEDETLPLDMIESDDDQLLQSDFEQKRRRFAEDAEENHNRRYLLPLKSATGQLIPQMAEEIEIPDAEEAEPQESTSQAIPKKTETVVEKFANRCRSLKETKERIASIAHLLLMDPQENIHKLKELTELAESPNDPSVSLSTSHLALASLLEIYLDIIPGYLIRELTEEEKRQQMKKETKRLREFEEILLRNYHRYLQFILELVKSHRKRAANGISASVKEKFSIFAVKCLCRLFSKHPHFNFSDTIVANLVPEAGSKNLEIVEVVCQTIETVFKEDRTGEISLAITKQLNELTKSKSKSLTARALSTLLALEIKNVDRRDSSHEERKRVRYEKLKEMSRKARKREKEMAQLERELRENDAEFSKKMKLRTHTEIINIVFTIYFRTLKRLEHYSLLGPVLEGLSKFAHLINVEFFDDLISTLHGLLESEKLNLLESLHCIHTVFVILSGEGEALNIDPYRFYKSLYQLLPSTFQTNDCDLLSKQVTICLRCLDLMFNKRRKLVTLPRAAAFVKRLAAIALDAPVQVTVATLVCIRSMMISHPELECLLDSEAKGSSQFQSDVDDPEHCGAEGSNLFELFALEKHQFHVIRKFAKHLLKGCPVQGEGQLPLEWLQKDPVDWLKLLQNFSDRIFTKI